MNKGPERQDEPREGNPWVNIGRYVFLIAVLVAAWFVLDWLIG